MSGPSEDMIRSTNWMGSIPVVLTLAPTSLSSPTIPPPIHVMVPRNTYLHVGLRSAILRLNKFAPSILLNFSSGLVRRIEAEQVTTQQEEKEDNGKNDKEKEDENGDKDTEIISVNQNNSDNNNNNNGTTDYPVCWLEDEERQIPLRWHLFAGVLYDMRNNNNNTIQRQGQPQNNNSNNRQDSDILQKELPWRIRLHFSSYPSSQILPLERNLVWTTMERTFKNSLKQALFLQYGNSKVAMNMTKQSHERLWDSIVTTNYPLYQQINVDLQKSIRNNTNSSKQEAPELLPIRIFVNSKPPIQRPCNIKKNGLLTLGSLLVEWIPEYFQPKEELDEWQLNDSEDENTNNNNNNKPIVIQPKLESTYWLVSGIVPPLSTPIYDLWRNLCHPDHFLYIIIIADESN